MTATAYAPTFPTVRTAPYRRKPAYRGPLIVIPGGRAALRRAALAQAASARAGTALPDPISNESAAAARAFQARLDALPPRAEITLQPSSKSVRVNSRTRNLTPREFGLLEALAKSPGQPVSRARLLEAGTDTDRALAESSRAVDVHVAHLRNKLALPGVIATVRGLGYALNPAYRVSRAD